MLQALNHFKNISVFPKDGCFMLSKFGVDVWRNHGATCVPKNCRQTDGISSLYSRFEIRISLNNPIRQ